MTFTSLARAGTAMALALVPVAAAAQDGVPVAELARGVHIPQDSFTLPNGLRVVVHTDRSVKVVAVNVAYDVGSRHEPVGRTGFAHLFEHLMFGGSENAPGDMLVRLKAIGVTENNGMTQDDRTLYYETVPTPALEQVLFLESDRMGHLLGAVTQTTLDEQRNVVKNEKRQGDNQPGGLVADHLTGALYPRDHPYGHSVIGSMADLDAASLADVRSWFRDHYGPGNVVLTLAGDIDVATARVLTARYFGGIPSGPRNVAIAAPVPTLPARVDAILTDRVPATTLYRVWTVPGRVDPAATALDAAAGTLAMIGASPLEEALVRRARMFTWVSAENSLMDHGGMFIVSGEVAEGVDPVAAGRALDAALAAFLRAGPTPDDLRRFVTMDVAGDLQRLGSVSGRAFTLSEGVLLGKGADGYRARLDMLAAQTPASVRAAAAHWLGRPVYALTLAPGARMQTVDTPTDTAPPPPPAPRVVVPVVPPTRPIPAIGTFSDLAFPTIGRARLRNGIMLVHARSQASPISYVTVDFDAGTAADPAKAIGTQALLLTLLDEGSATRDATALARARELLGAQTGTALTGDRTSVMLTVPSGNLAPATMLLADMIRHPAFAPAAIERRRSAQVARIADELADPGALGNRIRLPMFDAASPYAKGIGAGDADAVAALTRADLVAFHGQWLRPDKATIFVVSDRPLDEVRAALDAAFGDWQARGPAGAKSFDVPPRPAAPQIVLIDRPDSTQSAILAGEALSLQSPEAQIALGVANDALGGGFLSRLNTDLRERRGWSYGISAAFRTPAFATTFGISTSVQLDRTGAAIGAIRDIVREYTTTQPMTQAEFDLAVSSRIRALPGRMASAQAILSAMRDNDLYGRADEYQATLTSRYRALTLDEVHAAAKAIDPAQLFWVVVGDAAKVRPQLDGLGLPVTTLSAAAEKDS